MFGHSFVAHLERYMAKDRPNKIWDRTILCSGVGLRVLKALAWPRPRNVPKIKSL